MTDEELFLKEGAYYFGNRLLHRHVDVGVKIPGGSLVLTSAGEDMRDEFKQITDVEIKVKAPRGKKSETATDIMSELETLDL